MVDNVDPRENVDEQLGVSRVPSCHSLDIVRHLRSAVQGLALLHLIDHLPHIHFDLPGIFREPVETFCRKGVSHSTVMTLSDIHTARALVEHMKPADETDRSCEAHHRRKATAAHMRRAHSLHDPEGNWGDGGHSTGHGVVRRSSISKNTSEVPRFNGESLTQTSDFAERGGGHTDRNQ